jgi:hypothetical protein
MAGRLTDGSKQGREISEESINNAVLHDGRFRNCDHCDRRELLVDRRIWILGTNFQAHGGTEIASVQSNR